ncbi:hypothetical protein VSP9026_01563 [Vibrio spartinae]|uniref:WD40 repeat protein n=1 Tax=Vibrio spartinae TaxID=1918945 RepID=A0A1N6M371_9VIBR|nr:hypothetical protein VSP9026_01563 [Vibrio spartinae]
MRNVKWYVAILSFVCSGSGFSASHKSDLTQFDFPFLIGEWYLMNPDPEDPHQDFMSIHLTLSSSYTFAVQVKKRDSSIEYWEGGYTASQDTLMLGTHTIEPQIYTYQTTHNRLMLNGVTFFKALSRTLVGYWQSEYLSGTEVGVVGVTQIQLILQPDFLFFIRSVDEQGNEAVHRGVYYTENDHLVLLYDQGEHDTRFQVSADQLTVNFENGAMVAVLNRVE